MAKADEKTMTMVKMVSMTAWEHICTHTKQSVIFSWGVRGIGGGMVTTEDGTKHPALILDVDALIHSGLVCVAWCGGLYSITLFDRDKRRVTQWHTGLRFDQLGDEIDALIERPKDMSDEDYKMLSSLDSFLKMLRDL